jgi:hypothetical protein
MELLGDVGHVESCFGPFGDYVNVGPFGYSANLDARLVHSWRLMYHGDSVSVCARSMQVYAKHTTGTEIILDAHDGTTR